MNIGASVVAVINIGESKNNLINSGLKSNNKLVTKLNLKSIINIYIYIYI
jgi:Na+-transporting NADH:ubiquinone oxidoreductase subunit NqrE